MNQYMYYCATYPYYLYGIIKNICTLKLNNSFIHRPKYCSIFLVEKCFVCKFVEVLFGLWTSFMWFGIDNVQWDCLP